MQKHQTERLLRSVDLLRKFVTDNGIDLESLKFVA